MNRQKRARWSRRRHRKRRRRQTRCQRRHKRRRQRKRRQRRHRQRRGQQRKRRKQRCHRGPRARQRQRRNHRGRPRQQTRHRRRRRQLVRQRRRKRQRGKCRERRCLAEGPVEETPVGDEATAEETPADELPAEETPAPGEEPAAEEGPTQEEPAGEVSTEEVAAAEVDQPPVPAEEGLAQEETPEATVEAAPVEEEPTPEEIPSVGAPAEEARPQEAAEGDAPPMPPAASATTADEDIAKVSEALRQIYATLAEMVTGPIDFTQFKAILASLRYEVAESELQLSFASLDLDKDGVVGAEDFVGTMTNERLFARFIMALPDTCADNAHQKGFLDDRIFFEILTVLLRAQTLSEATMITLVEYYYRKKKGARLKSTKVESEALKDRTFMGVSVYSLIQYLDVLEPDDDYKENALTPVQEEAFNEVFQLFQKAGEDGNAIIEPAGILEMMRRMSMQVRNPFIPDEEKLLTVNRGKGVTLGDFLRILSNTSTFASFLKPIASPACGLPLPPELMAFGLLLDNLEAVAVQPETRQALVDFYRGRFGKVKGKLPSHARVPQQQPASLTKKGAKQQKMAARGAGGEGVRRAKAGEGGPVRTRPRTVEESRGGRQQPPPLPGADGRRQSSRRGTPQVRGRAAATREKMPVTADGGTANRQSILQNVRTYRQQCASWVVQPDSQAPRPLRKKAK
ncbi:uncharacterized protein LOC129693852 [Leucoraja erinacea]|uniref:uncharacterized protein LOC129693852 n=1 Tax=Leucoraja erinaceus TaxID=7782 RepID=UPI002454236B|nr:uncharacterized protein LOC129693852 [Leucoraja erinacea]